LFGDGVCARIKEELLKDRCVAWLQNQGMLGTKTK